MLDAVTKWIEAHIDDILVGVIIAAIVGIGVVFRKKLFPGSPSSQGQTANSGEKSPTQIGNGKQNNYFGISEERFQKLSEEHGATKERLNSILKVLEEHEIPPDQLDAKLRESLEGQDKLLEGLDEAPKTGEATDQLREQASQAIEDGKFDEAKGLLLDAEARDTQAIAQLDDQARERRRAAAASAHALGGLAYSSIEYEDAALHFIRAAGLLEGMDGAGQAESLNKAGNAYYQLARYAKAEPLMERALRIDEKAFGPDHPNIAIHLNNLAALYQATNRLAEAEPLMERALMIDEKAFGPDHPNIAIHLNNLAQLYKATNRLAEAEPLMERALRINEKAFDPGHPGCRHRPQQPGPAL